MDPVSAHDVARAIRARIPDVGALKLQKLLYYCQGWHLALTGEPLFRERIEAWTNGPVVADLWHAEDKGFPPPEATDLSAHQQASIAFVTGRFRLTSGAQLKHMTHEEPPWTDAIETSEFANPEITHDALREFFGSLVNKDAADAVSAIGKAHEQREALIEDQRRMEITPPTPDEPGWLEAELERL